MAKNTESLTAAATIAGKPLYPATNDNPRRKGTHGHKSMAIILRHPGISYEDFIAKGGRYRDLWWDMEHGNVTTTKPRARSSKARAA